MLRAHLLTLAVATALASAAMAAEPPVPPRPPRPPVPPGFRGVEPFEREMAPSGTWIGLQLTPVPAALAAHLPLEEGSGLMVRNVFTGSPADHAGIRQYDVLISADGEKVGGAVEEFSRHVRSRKPDESMQLELLRKGERISVEVKLEKAPRRTPEAKFPDDDPDVLRWRNFGLRGKVLRPGPEGWVMEDLGRLPDFLYFWGDGDREDAATEGRIVDKDGSALHVTRLPDGKIEVRRFEKGQEKDAEVKTYADEQELKSADPKAFELLQQIRKGADRERFWTRPLPQAPRREADRLWREYRKYLEPRSVEPELPQAAPQPARPAPEGEFGGPPPVRFDVDEEGRVTVHVRRDDAEMNMTFRSEEAFKQRAPELYKQYEQMERELR